MDTSSNDITGQKPPQEMSGTHDPLFAALAEHSSDCVWLADAHGRVLYANRRWKEYTGLTVEQANDEGWSPLPAEEFPVLPAPDAFPPAPQATDMQEQEYLFRRHDGQFRWFRERRVPIHGETTQYILIATDIHEEKTAGAETAGERFRLVADSAPVLIWMADPDNRGIYFNRSWLEFTGRTLEEETGDGWIEAVHPDDLGLAVEVCGSALRHQIPFTTQFRLRRADGEYRWVLDNGVPHFNPDGTLAGYIGSCIDITDRRAWEEALRENEERLRLAVEATGLGTWDFNPTTGALRWSERCGAIFGLPAGSGLTYHMIVERLHPEDRRQVEAAVRLALDPASGGNCDIEFRVIDPEAPEGERWAEARGQAFFDENGRATRFIGTILDVTCQKGAARERAHLLKREQDARAQAESAQERSEFLAGASDALSRSLDYEATIASLARLTIPYIADYCMIFELQPEGDLRQVAYAHLIPEQEPLLHRLARIYKPLPGNPNSLVGRAMQSQQSIMLREISIDDARKITLHSELLDIFQQLEPRSGLFLPIISHGMVLGVLQLNMSVSGRSYDDQMLKLAEELALRAAAAMENARLYREAQQANSAKDTFLAVLSHELRTPLTPALASIQALREEELPEEVQPFVDIIHRNIELEARLIDDLLDITRIMRGKLNLEIETADLHQLVQHVLDIVRSDIKAGGLLLSVDLRAAHHQVQGDPARLQQVLWNVVKNAIKFTPAGGSISITSHTTGTDVVIEVRDSGIGIDPALLPVIFNAFEQGEQGMNRRFGGLGLGLAISRTLVQMHGGSIAASSTGRNEGSTFTITLPLIDSSAMSGKSGGQSEGEITTASGRRRDIDILLVDGHHDTINIVRPLLERWGYRVRTAYTLRTALEAAAHHRFDLVITDMKLPDGTGSDLLQQLRSYSDVKAIAIGSHDSSGEPPPPGTDGFARHLRKPFPPRALYEAIEEIYD